MLNIKKSMPENGMTVDYLSNICSWDAIISEKDNKYQTIIPLPFKKKIGLKYLYQPFFCQQLGIFSLSPLNKIEEENILKLIRSKFIFGYFQWNSPIMNNPFIVSEKAPNYVLNLSDTYEQLRKGYNSNVSNDSNNLEKVIYDFKEELGHKFPEVEEEHYNNLVKGLKQSSILSYSIISILEDNNTLAASLFIHFKNRSIYLLGYTKPDFMSTGINTLIFDFLIQKQVEKPKILDFEGSKIPGIAKFYQSFGARNQYYYKNKLNFNLFFFLKN